MPPLGARAARTQVAAITKKRAAIAAYVVGSIGFTPISMLLMTRVNAAAAARPTRIPAALRRKPWLTINWKIPAWGRTQRHADTDLGSALPHQRRQHAIEADTGKDRGDRGKYADQKQLESRGGLRLSHQRIHGLHFHQHHVGIVLGHGGADCGAQLRGVAVHAQRPAVDASVIHIAIGEVHLLAAGNGQRGCAYVSSHADDLDPLGLQLAYPDQYALADGGFVRECLGGEQLIHHHHIAVAGIVGVGEAAPGDQRRVHGFEVAGEDEEVVHRLKLARVGQRGGEAPADGEEWSGERKRSGGGDTPHAGNRAQSVRQVAHPRRALRRLRSTPPAQGEKRQQMAGVETGIDALKFQEAAYHQSAADQQHEGERHFGDHHDVAQHPRIPQARGATAAAQHDGDIGARGAQGRHDTEEPRGHERGGRGEGDHHRIDGDGVEARQVRRSERA